MNSDLSINPFINHWKETMVLLTITTKHWLECQGYGTVKVRQVHCCCVWRITVKRVRLCNHQEVWATWVGAPLKWLPFSKPGTQQVSRILSLGQDFGPVFGAEPEKKSFIKNLVFISVCLSTTMRMEIDYKVSDL